jgi:hypothetical protein
VSIFDRKYLLGGQQGAQATADLNFLTGTLDPRITFSRADTTPNASYTDSTGVMRFGPTNLMTFSADMTAWTLTNTTATLASGAAPDGSNTMNRIAETATTSTHYINRNIAVVAGTVYTTSIYAKAAERQYLQVNYDDGTNGAVATFDLVGGTITGALAARGTGTAIGAAITAIGNGIYRCSITASHGSTTGRMLVSLAITANPAVAPSYAGNAGSGLLVWGAQIEANSAPGPYVATAAAALSGPRFDYSPATVFNYVRNSTMVGATNGVLSAAPFMGTWGTSIGNGLTWSIVGSGTEGGIAYVDIAVSGTATALTGQYIIFDTTVNPTSGGLLWTGSAYFRLISGTAPGNHGIYIVDNVAGNQALFGLSGGPLATQRASYTYTTNASATTVAVRYRYGPPDTVTAVSFTIRIGAPQLEAASSVGAFVPTSGAQAGSGGVLRGLLIEESRTNLAFPSNALATLFTPAAATLTAASGTAPDGTLTMARLAEAATTAIHSASKTAVTVTASATYTVSVYAQAQQNQYLQLYYDDGTSIGLDANFDLVNGTIARAVTAHSTGTATGAAIQAVGGGVYRCSITGVAGATTSARFGVVLIPAAGSGFAPTYAGNASNGLLVWGAQLEASNTNVGTSYIPTTTAAVGRAADFVSMSLSPPLAFSLAGDFMIPVPTPTSVIQGILVIDDGNINNRIPLRSTGGAQVQAAAVVAGTGTATSSSPAVVNVNAVMKGAYASNGGASTLALAVNGVTYVAGSGAQPTGLTTLRMGQNNANGNLLNGWVRRVRYYSRPLSNSELQTVTK